LEPLALEMGRPVSRGFALVLVAVVLAALGWVDHREAARFDTVESAVAGTTSSVVQGTSATVVQGAAADPEADPETCWLLGVIAGGQGRADLVSRLAATTSSTGDCQLYAARGARGQDLEG